MPVPTNIRLSFSPTQSNVPPNTSTFPPSYKHHHSSARLLFHLCTPPPCNPLQPPPTTQQHFRHHVYRACVSIPPPPSTTFAQKYPSTCPTIIVVLSPLWRGDQEKYSTRQMVTAIQEKATWDTIHERERHSLLLSRRLSPRGMDNRHRKIWAWMTQHTHPPSDINNNTTNSWQDNS